MQPASLCSASLSLVAALTLGCGAGSAPKGAALLEPSAGAKDVSSGSPVERYFPLVDGRMYHYVTTSDAGGSGMLVARVFRTDARRGELRLPSRTRRFAYRADAVVLDEGPQPGAAILMSPLQVGNAWRGEHGGTTTIVAIEQGVDAPAGHFDGCVVTLERRGGDAPAQFATTFCPDVGIVRLEVQSGPTIETAELKSYGAPLVIGPDGLQRVE